jgi:hypothetical protein
VISAVVNAAPNSKRVVIVNMVIFFLIIFMFALESYRKNTGE